MKKFTWNVWRPILIRHVVLGLIAYGLYWIFFISKEGLPSGHQINRAWADASIVFLVVSLLIGPLVKYWKGLSRLIIWRREIGVWFAITSLIHIGLLAQRNQWDLLRFFLSPEGELLKAAAHASNWVGLVALVGTLILTVTSNNFSERWLGFSAWKFLQLLAYNVFILSMIHTFIFIYMADSRKSELIRLVFWIGFVLVLVFQVMGFFYTVYRSKKRKSASEIKATA